MRYFYLLRETPGVFGKGRIHIVHVWGRGVLHLPQRKLHGNERVAFWGSHFLLGFGYESTRRDGTWAMHVCEDQE
jgi:hypothetical protein